MTAMTAEWLRNVYPVTTVLCGTLLIETFIIGAVIINVVNTIGEVVTACCGV